MCREGYLYYILQVCNQHITFYRFCLWLLAFYWATFHIIQLNWYLWYFYLIHQHNNILGGINFISKVDIFKYSLFNQNVWIIIKLKCHKDTHVYQICTNSLFIKNWDMLCIVHHHRPLEENSRSPYQLLAKKSKKSLSRAYFNCFAIFYSIYHIFTCFWEMWPTVLLKNLAMLPLYLYLFFRQPFSPTHLINVN